MASARLSLPKSGERASVEIVGSSGAASGADQVWPASCEYSNPSSAVPAMSVGSSAKAGDAARVSSGRLASPSSLRRHVSP